jgi:hypothetical protein
VKTARSILILTVLAACVAGAAEPTFGDLAVLLAKGYLKGQVPSDARLEQCVLFLNRHGIRFSIFDLIDPDKVVTKEDTARVVGQSALLFSGSEEVVNGSIKKPLEAETWVDYCLLNDIDFTSLWGGLLKSTEEGMLPEVRQFFRR